MTRIIGAAAFLTIALAAYAASLNPYEARNTAYGYSQQSDNRDSDHTASIR
ncbi:hypothetical protein [Rhizobium sp. Root1203]|uniref:hypothetical protein n=1 Tax=Rhizobium sp. Root1203 TaxID=1736427 RepID=UPI000ABE0367|nr:hypothetical protein [Rhizobium sp. Root1203]